ncbi:SOS response-associated peptidase [Heyndrickxia acidicola]|uniref:Abasic site processing protein n=1 Tax=Heyndrickxia acidicola TaxID=209389 RepID=A0ABU6MGE5_9BACI|nr:SOS response-associated peptidase [Heyndrickxia acidicola]MED1203354.1 SOS response-associated peptidase [Heyndrickxia acidicola]
MCGRFTLHASPEELLEYFNILSMDDLELSYRYNIAPGQDILSIVQGKEGNRVGLLKWGLVPSWAKDSKIGYNMINARAESIHEKPSFKRLIKRRRCIIAADGFYEWKKEGNQKQPYYIRMKNQRLFGFAGLWDRWEHEGKVLTTCTIITTTPNKLMESIHDRMPVILTKEAQSIWLNRAVEEEATLQPLLTPYDSEEMEAVPVSTRVNYAKIDSADLIQPIAP